MNKTNATNPQKGDAVSRFVRELRDVQRVPVSFIQASDQIESIELRAGRDTGAVLEELVRQTPMYRRSEIDHRYVLYPKSSVWETEISGIDIKNVPRLAAATQFIVQARRVISDLGDVSEPPMIGDPRSPVYQQPVSLPSRGSVLQHLVALLGPDQRIVFTLEPTLFGDRVLHFERVPER